MNNSKIISENIKINYIEICLALLRFMKVGFISNKVNEYKINNVKYVDVLKVIKIDIINGQIHHRKKI